MRDGISGASQRFKMLLKGAVFLLGGLILASGLLVLYLTITEYRPDSEEPVDILNAQEKRIETSSLSSPIRLLSWNIGYGALGDNADFFMDGGRMVYTANKERVMENMTSMIEAAKAENPDILFLQEVDRSSARSFQIDEAAMIREAFPDMESSFGQNFKSAFVPYPIPPIGKVDSGILTLSRLAESDAVRVALPCPFRWPIRTVNLKRCLLLSRLPLPEGKELVLVNFHLEAYDHGEGKIAQTKMLRDLLQKEVEAGNYVIAGGDFNQTIFSMDPSANPAYEGLWTPGILDLEAFGSSFRFCMDDAPPTCRSLDRIYEGADKETFPAYIIDGFVVSSNIEVKRLETLDLSFRWSDHNPVLLEFTLSD